MSSSSVAEYGSASVVFNRSELQLRFLVVGQYGVWFLWDVAGGFFVDC